MKNNFKIRSKAKQTFDSTKSGSSIVKGNNFLPLINKSNLITKESNLEDKNTAFEEEKFIRRTFFRLKLNSLRSKESVSPSTGLIKKNFQKDNKYQNKEEIFEGDIIRGRTQLNKLKTRNNEYIPGYFGTAETKAFIPSRKSTSLQRNNISASKTFSKSKKGNYQEYRSVSKSKNMKKSENQKYFEENLEKKIDQKVESPRSMIYKVSAKSQVGKMPGITNKINQDAYLICKNFANERGNSLFGIFDGHGMNGHNVSSFLKRMLGKLIEKNYNKLINLEISKSISIEDVLRAGIKETIQNLENTKIDLSFSGSTCCVTFIERRKVTIANIGDSRAVIGSFTNGKWIAKALSNDHKPDDHLEALRIKNHGGRINQIENHLGESVGPLRVWLKYEDTPGLAMTRSVGDIVSQSVGVIDEPEITNFEILEEDKFLILASDGIWEFISNEEAIKIVSNYYCKKIPEIACDRLINEAIKKWSVFGSSCDDITCIIAFFR